MDAIEAITQRRMIPRVGDEPLPRQTIEELLELAVRAPNHHRTEPWRFYVLSGDARDRLARAIAEEAVEGGTDPDRAAADARKKVERAPHIVVFTSVRSDDPKVIEQEDIVSVGMAMQNVLIGAYARGIGAMLRTGTVSYRPTIAQHLGLADGETVVGMLYLGVPHGERERTERAPAAEKTTWFD